MDFKQLRSFLVLAHELHFGRAAVRLHMTQPPLSRQMQQLENDLGVELFERTSRCVRLTSAGNAMVVEAQKLLQMRESALQVVRQAAKIDGGSVIVGMVGAVAYGFLPRLVTAARTELPNTEIRFREMVSAQQLEELALHRIDVALVRPFTYEHDNFVSKCVMREEFALALRADHPLAASRKPVLRQLDGEQFIMYSTDSPYLHSLLTASFREENIQPNFVQELTQVYAMLAMVSAGVGIAIVPKEAANASFANIVFRPIDLASQPTLDLYAVWRNDNRNPVLQAFCDLLQRIELDRR